MLIIKIPMDMFSEKDSYGVNRQNTYGYVFRKG